MTIETRDGRRLQRRAETRKGDPEDPLSDAEIEAKFRELAAPVLSTSRAERLLETLWRLEELPDLDALPPSGRALASRRPTVARAQSARVPGASSD